MPAAAIAPILLAQRSSAGFREAARTYWPLYGILVGGGVLALLDTVARGESVTTLLGAYKAATAGTYTVNGVLHYLLWHVSELDLSLGIIPFAALLALWLAPREAPPAARAFIAATLPVVVLLVIEVATFASVNSDRVEERNMFYVAPLALMAMVALAGTGVISRRRRVLIPAATVAALLPFFLPFARLIGPPVVSDTFALLPWWWIQDQGIHLNNLRWAAVGISIPAAALFVYLPRRFALSLAALVAVFFIAQLCGRRERAASGSSSTRSGRSGPGSRSRIATGSTGLLGRTPRSTTSGPGRRVCIRSGRTRSSTAASVGS